jgi:cyanamide hydratase
MSKYGFVAVPRDIQAILKGRPYVNVPTPQTINSIKIPDSYVARAVQQYAKRELPEPVYNHSVRVFYYGSAIQKDQFPEWDLDPEVYYVTCLLHDIATTEKNMVATKMSFEFYGGLISRDLVLKETKGDQDYAEAVSEAIIRHQDLGTVGTITTLGLLLQLATILDNVGLHTSLIDKSTIDSVNRGVPRHEWLSCFAKAIDNENSKKPWGHTSALGKEDFRNDVLGNKVMKKYEDEEVASR